MNTSQNDEADERAYVRGLVLDQLLAQPMTMDAFLRVKRNMSPEQQRRADSELRALVDERHIRWGVAPEATCSPLFTPTTKGVRLLSEHRAKKEATKK